MSYPFKWKPLSIDASAKIKVLFEDDSSVQNYVVSEPMGVFGQANLQLLKKSSISKSGQMIFG